jgi:hypothetical protein
MIPDMIAGLVSAFGGPIGHVGSHATRHATAKALQGIERQITLIRLPKSPNQANLNQ